MRTESLKTINSVSDNNELSSTTAEGALAAAASAASSTDESSNNNNVGTKIKKGGGGGGGFLNHLTKNNSLKRSLTLPRTSNSDDGSAGAEKSKDGQSPRHNNRFIGGGGGSSSNSVRNFFNRVVTQVSRSSNGYSKSLSSASASSSSASASAAYNNEERIKEWKKRFEDKVPGVIGIRNHGNTCFINAILQCLSYTDLLAEYFVLDQYKYDLKRKRRINNFNKFKKRSNNLVNGMSGNGSVGGKTGEVTEQLATLLKSLWSLQYEPEISVKFKAIIEKYGSQYKGGTQQDAQEFLLWLLDRVHEDLNTATKKKYKINDLIAGKLKAKTDEDLANEALSNYMRCNSSFVMDVFQAQFRSSLTCPTCERQSNTFDPFLCVSLPIPHKQLMPVFVTVLYIDQTPRQVKLGLTIGLDQTVGDLRRSLSKDTGIPFDQILLTEISERSFHRSFNDSQPVSVVNEKKSKSVELYCIEIPRFKLASEDDGAYVVLTWINVLRIKDKVPEERFGTPYAIQLSRETLYVDLQKLLMKEMAGIIHEDVLPSTQKVPLFKIRVLDGLDDEGSSSYLDSNVELPMYTECVEQAVNLCTVQNRPVHVKLILEWDAYAKSQIISNDSNPVEIHSSVAAVKESCGGEDSIQDAKSVSLQECFSLYTSEERLGQGDAWFCPDCNRKREVVKKMGLWSVPDVLVIHLKRFRQNSSSSSTSNKLVTMVDFPLEGFDMSPNVTNRSTSAVASTAAAAAVSKPPEVDHHHSWTSAFSPWKNPKRYLTQQQHKVIHHHHHHHHQNNQDYIYDLYAICNHHGTDLQGGHYTATCLNPTDGRWYEFDDVHTKAVKESEVITRDAYILFYQRRPAASADSSSSSASSTSSSSSSEHWVYRMPDFTYKAKTKSTLSSSTTSSKSDEKKQKKTVEVKKEESSTQSSNNSNFKRNSGKYATLPTKRSSDIIKCEVEHFSDGEQDDDEEEEEEILSTTVTLIQKKIDKIPEEEEDDDDDVSRPIDTNDVD